MAYRVSATLLRHFRSSCASRTSVYLISKSTGSQQYLKFPTRYFCSTKIEHSSSSRLLEDLCEKFKRDAATQKRVSAKDFEKILDINQNVVQPALLLESLDNYLPDQSREEKIRLLEKLWKKCLAGNVINASLCGHFLNAFANLNFDIGDHKQFLKPTNLELNPALMTDLLKYYSTFGKTVQINQLLEEMKGNGIKITEIMYSFLILGHSRSKNLDGVKSVLDTMAEANVELGTASYTELIKANLENNQLSKATDLLKRVEGLPEPNVIDIIQTMIAYSSLFTSTDNLKNTLFIAIHRLPEITVQNPEMAPSLRNICTELAFANQFDAIVALIDCLPVPERPPNSHTDQYALRLIKEIVRKDSKLEDITRFCKYLISSKRNEHAIHVAIEAAMKYGKDKVAVELLTGLSAVEQLRPHYFWPLFLMAQRMKKEAGILEVLKLMNKLNVTVDHDTVNQYLLPKLSVTLKDTKRSIKMLEDHGLKLSQMIAPLISSLLYQRRLGDVFQVLTSYQTRLDTEQLIRPLILLTTLNAARQSDIAKLIKMLNEKATTSTYDLGGHLLVELVSNPKMQNNVEYIERILGEFNLFGVQISSIAADILRQHFFKVAAIDSTEPADKEIFLKKLINKNLSIPAVEVFSTQILHPRDMNLEQLECHFKELIAKEMNTRGVLRRLLTLNCREGKLERALEIKKLCDEFEVELSPGMMANIFDLYVKMKDLEKANVALQQMRDRFPGFLLDEHKIIDYAALMVETGKLDDAKQVLKKYASQHKLKAGMNIMKNLWQLLKNVSTVSGELKLPGNQTNEFLKLLVQLGYCDTKNNSLLGPIIREHFAKGEIRLAVEQYKKICVKYRKTPLQLELYTTLIAISNNPEGQFDLTADEAKTMLEECLAGSTAIHGSENTHIHLIVALAEAGTQNQLRKLLIDPAVRIDMEVLKNQCEHLSELGKFETVLKLAKCCRGLGHIKEQELYNIILNHFVRVNDYEAALGLYERILGEDDFKLSGVFMNQLVDLLEKNNLQVPTSVALYAKRENN